MDLPSCLPSSSSSFIKTIQTHTFFPTSLSTNFLSLKNASFSLFKPLPLYRTNTEGKEEEKVDQSTRVFIFFLVFIQNWTRRVGFALVFCVLLCGLWGFFLFWLVIYFCFVVEFSVFVSVKPGWISLVFFFFFFIWWNPGITEKRSGYFWKIRDRLNGEKFR